MAMRWSSASDKGAVSEDHHNVLRLLHQLCPRLVGSLSNKRSLSFSFDKAARVESLGKGLLASRSSTFWLFSALLHWLKELCFVPPDPALFGQLVQEMSGAMVSSALNSAALATYLAAKRREGILSHFPSHVGAHFKKKLASPSFETPFFV